ncbi:uncharacterized protein BXZ73DRAFT_96854 [Epithele typhae]|uniref:uncharacterized protein n=1 Tax=Epithele typhae TaxID=378194 RepID=UPI002008086D|nr:uncharacterized protein BXZ73DRAFT_96854 [Epithele typhae]KAH9944365.1 hypothetical protein BXZ73DRAFT_96854 [Epithele typhae]
MANHHTALETESSQICHDCKSFVHGIAVSFGCKVCKLPIPDDVIVSGDDAYHRHCYRCRLCKNSIDDLVCVKTSRGIYCMPCHSERAEKRKQARQQRDCDRERVA